MVVTIDERHRDITSLERPRRIEAGKAAADDHDPRTSCRNRHGLHEMILRVGRCPTAAPPVTLDLCLPPAVAPPASHVETACPLDCPDACTLSVTLRGGRVTNIDGSTANEITRGYICAKVRRFHHRVYGDDRLLHPAIMDVILIAFGAVNAVLYFGFDSAVLLNHIDAVIYSVLVTQATWSLVRDPPWTAQFTKRTVTPQAWELPEFRSVNRFATAIWAACFAVCDVIALTAAPPARLRRRRAARPLQPVRATSSKN